MKPNLYVDPTKFHTESMKCKPCITIRDTVKIIWANIKRLPQSIRNDMRSHATVNAVVCTLDKTSVDDNAFNPVSRTMAKIRTLALENHNPQPYGKCNNPEAKDDFSVCEKVRQLSELK